MTNEQLKIMLLSIASKLEAATNEADDSLGEVERHIEKRYVGKDMFRITPSVNPEDYKEFPGSAVALDSIREVIKEINKHAGMLTPGYKDID